MITGVSCSVAVIVFDPSAEPTGAANRDGEIAWKNRDSHLFLEGKGNTGTVTYFLSCLQRRSIAQPLMRPLGVIVLNELAHEVIEVLGPLRHEVVEALLLQCPNEPLGVAERKKVRAARPYRPATTEWSAQRDPTGSLRVRSRGVPGARLRIAGWGFTARSVPRHPWRVGEDCGDWGFTGRSVPRRARRGLWGCGAALL